ncbi:MAG: protease [Patescibacteria group bacterium]|nr:protease [Patescibacteria group bacterium]
MTKRAKILIGILLFLLIGLVLYYLLILRLERVTIYDQGTYDPETGELYADNSCNVIGINLHGEIFTYVPLENEEGDYASGENIISELQEIEESPEYESVKAVLIEIDSYGGSPVASEELSNMITDYNLPVIAMIREGGTSGAYWVASASDRIFASKMSDIGSIGVTMSYLDDSKLNEKEGYTWNSLSTGKFKDSGNEQKPLTKEERALFERDLNIIHEEFVKAVSVNRNLPIEKVRELADGSSMLGEMALEQGLIDEIGSYKEVEEYLKTKYDFEPEICW